jgi:hypothetical protein
LKPPKREDLRELLSKVNKVLAELQARGGNEALIAEVQAMLARLGSGANLPTKGEVEALVERVKDALESTPDGSDDDSDDDDSSDDDSSDDDDSGDSSSDDDSSDDDSSDVTGGAGSRMGEQVRLGRALGEITYLLGRLDPTVAEQATAIQALTDLQQRIMAGEPVTRDEVRAAVDAAVELLGDRSEKTRTVLTGVITAIEDRLPEVADQLRDILSLIGEGSADEVRSQLEAVRVALIERYAARLSAVVDRVEAALGSAITPEQALVISEARAVLALPATELTKDRLRAVRASLRPLIESLSSDEPVDTTVPVDTTLPVDTTIVVESTLP